jgi:DnaJ-class molecular chaperone
MAALKLLSLAAPTTANALKTAYRRKSKLEHPDHSQHPDAQARFQAVSAAYTLLLGDASVLDLIDVTANHACTVEGDAFAELGRGLGTTVSGAECGECRGAGYTSHGSLSRPCPDCQSREFMRWEYRCRKCSGTGVFLARGGKRGECYPCHGTGWLREHGYGNRCLTCGGLGRVESRERAYNTCYECKGKGELPMWNPVIPRGLIIPMGGK